MIERRKPPKAVGWTEDLYALAGLPEPLHQYIEKRFLLTADQYANDALQLLLTNNLHLPAKLRSGWSRFVITLLSRTPERIARLREAYSTQYAQLSAEIEKEYDTRHANDEIQPSKEEKANTLAQAREIGIGKLLQRVMDLPNVGQHLNNMYWTVFKLDNGRRNLLTSDRPVYMPVGLKDKNGFVGIPISPTQLFVAANDKNIVENLKGMCAGDLTSSINLTIVSQAQRYVFATDSFQVNFVEKHLRHNHT